MSELGRRLKAPFIVARDDLREFRRAYGETPVPELNWDVLGFRATFRRAMPLLLKEHSSPGRMAFAVWLGAVVGSTPLYGLHYVIVIILAVFLRLNKLVIWLATNVSFPAFAPFIAFAGIQTGSLVTTGTLIELDWKVLAEADFTELATRFFGLWMVGGIFVGSILGVILAAPVYFFLRRRTEEA